MYDITCFGNCSYDLFLSDNIFQKTAKGPEELIEWGSKFEFNNFRACPGGGASNVAVSLAHSGLSVNLISRIGQDYFGKMILKNIYNKGIEYKNIQIDKKHKSPVSIIIVSKDGKKTVFIYRGSEKEINPKLIDFHKTVSRLFYISSLGGNIGFLEQVLGFANNNQIQTAFNPGMLEIKNNQILRFLPKIDYVFVNLKETRSLFNTENLDIILEKAKSTCKKLFLISDGEKGTYAIAKNQTLHSDIIHTPVKDLTGAGDAFAGGFLAGIVKSNNVKTALSYGSYNASKVVEKIGAQTGIVKEYPLEIDLKINNINTNKEVYENSN